MTYPHTQRDHLLLRYSLAYWFAVSADHLSTLMVLARGGVETNILLRRANGELAEAAAWSLFALLWPAMLMLIGLARRRAREQAGPANPISVFFLGRTAASALMLPLVLVAMKLIAAGLNIFLLLTGVSAGLAVRHLLKLIGEADPALAALIVNVGIMLVALAVATPVARRLAGGIGGGPWTRLVRDSQPAPHRRVNHPLSQTAPVGRDHVAARSKAAMERQIDTEGN